MFPPFNGSWMDFFFLFVCGPQSPGPGLPQISEQNILQVECPLVETMAGLSTRVVLMTYTLLLATVVQPGSDVWKYLHKTDDDYVQCKIGVRQILA